MADRISSLTQIKTVELAREDVTVDRWDAVFTVTELTGAQKSRWERDNTVTKGGRVIKTNTATMTPRLLAVAVVDDAGDPIATAEQWATFIRERGAGDIARLEEVAYRLSGITPADDQERDAEGNSPTPKPLTTG